MKILNSLENFNGILEEILEEFELTIHNVKIIQNRLSKEIKKLKKIIDKENAADEHSHNIS